MKKLIFTAMALGLFGCAGGNSEGDSSLSADSSNVASAFVQSRSFCNLSETIVTVDSTCVFLTDDFYIPLGKRLEAEVEVELESSQSAEVFLTLFEGDSSGTETFFVNGSTKKQVSVSSKACDRGRYSNIDLDVFTFDRVTLRNPTIKFAKLVDCN